MRNFILILLLLVSCGRQESRREIAPFEPGPQASAIWAGPRALYKSEIDVIVAFLWPDQITTEVQRSNVRQVIAVSRKLQPLKDEYVRVRRLLNREFEDLSCACVLDGACDADDSVFTACAAIEESQSQNNQLLARFYEHVEEIRGHVRAAGGEWISTNLDYPLLPPSSVDLQNFTIRLEAFGQQESEPISYVVNSPRVDAGSSVVRLLWSFPRLMSDGSLQGTWSFDVTVTEKNGESLIFQGDLYWDHAGVRRRGIVQWEHLRH